MSLSNPLIWKSTELMEPSKRPVASKEEDIVWGQTTQDWRDPSKWHQILFFFKGSPRFLGRKLNSSSQKVYWSWLAKNTWIFLRLSVKLHCCWRWRESVSNVQRKLLHQVLREQLRSKLIKRRLRTRLWTLVRRLELLKSLTKGSSSLVL